MASSSAVGSSPCGACKFLRRKCAPDCVFAPYFCPDDQGGPERFAAVHKVFGASNVSKLLLHVVPVHDRGDTILTVEYQAQARLKDPVYGCVAHIHALQSQVACLQVQLMQLRAQVAHHIKMVKGMNKLENQQWIVTSNTSLSSSVVVPSRLLGDHVEACYINSSGSPQSSIQSTTNIEDGNKNIGAMLGVQECTKRQQRTTSDYWHNEGSELQDLALRILKD